MKKIFWALIASFVIACTMATAAACTDTPGTPSGDDPSTEQPGENPGEEPGGDEESVYTIEMGGGDNRELDLNASSSITWTVTKDGAVVTDEPVSVTVGDDEVLSWDVQTQTVTAIGTGTSTLTVTLVNHTDVSAAITFRVVDRFFSRDIFRGDFNLANEANGVVTVTGGQATLVAKEAGTQFIFRATITLPSTASIGMNESFGVGSFADNGDHALWFGLRNNDNQNDGVFGVYQRNFFNGWGSATTDSTVKGYEACNTGNEIAFEIIRDGTDYYYSIGGFYGTYTDNTSHTAATYPGIYSQAIPLTVSAFSVSYDADEVAEAVAAYAEKGPAAVVINETMTRLLRGDSYVRTATVYPASAQGGASVVWSLDKTGMTAGQDGTSIAADTGELTLAADAEGNVTVIAECGSVSARQEITILTVSDEASNELLSVHGGVRLNEDGSITFPEIMNTENGVGSETEYEQTNYAAYLNDDLTGDFSVEFTVSDYQSVNNGSPKLQIALGEGNNNFYVVYTSDGIRVEAYTRALWSDGKYQPGWYVTDWITNLDPSQPHIFKIAVTAKDSAGRYGVYTVTIDGGEALTFKMDGTEVLLMRDLHALTTAQPVKFATNLGVSATVSNISAEKGNALSLPTFLSYNANSTITQDGKDFTTRYATTESWNARDNYINSVIYTPAVAEAFTMQFDAAFSRTTNDTKFIVRIGNWEYHINNKLGGTDGIQGSVYKNTWTDNFNVNVPDAALNVHVRIEYNNGAVRFIINDTVIEDVLSARPAASEVRFWVMNGDAEYTDYTVTVSDFSMTEYARADIYTFEADGTTERTLTVGMENTVTLTAKNNGDLLEGADAAYTYEIEDDAVISYDAETGTVTALAEGKSDITFKLAKDPSKTVTIEYTVTTAPTENDQLSVSGGAVLNADGSVTFPVTHQSTNGVGNEEAYETNSYSADLKQKVQGDFTIEFTVSDYQVAAGVEYPKLMLSLGGTHNQFYIAYKPNGEYRVETFTNHIDAETLQYSEGGAWVNSTNFAEFDTTAAHTYKIECVGGMYRVYMDGTELSFNINGSPRTMARSYADYIAELPVRFSTNGVSAKVSNIVLTQGEIADWYYTNSANITDVTKNGFTLVAFDGPGDGWDNVDGRQASKIYLTEQVPGDVTVTFDLTFSAGMTDGKFMIMLGGQRVMLNNKISVSGGLSVTINQNGEDWSESTISNENALTMKVKIVRTGTELNVYVNDVLIKSATCDDSSGLSFGVFNNTAADKEVTVTVSGLTVSENSAENE